MHSDIAPGPSEVQCPGDPGTGEATVDIREGACSDEQSYQMSPARDNMRTGNGYKNFAAVATHGCGHPPCMQAGPQPPAAATAAAAGCVAQVLHISKEQEVPAFGNSNSTQPAHSPAAVPLLAPQPPAVGSSPTAGTMPGQPQAQHSRSRSRSNQSGSNPVAGHAQGPVSMTTTSKFRLNNAKKALKPRQAPHQREPPKQQLTAESVDLLQRIDDALGPVDTAPTPPPRLKVPAKRTRSKALLKSSSKSKSVSQTQSVSGHRSAGRSCSGHNHNHTPSTNGKSMEQNSDAADDGQGADASSSYNSKSNSFESHTSGSASSDREDSDADSNVSDSNDGDGEGSDSGEGEGEGMDAADDSDPNTDADHQHSRDGDMPCDPTNPPLRELIKSPSALAQFEKDAENMDYSTYEGDADPLQIPVDLPPNEKVEQGVKDLQAQIEAHPDCMPKLSIKGHPVLAAVRAGQSVLRFFHMMDRRRGGNSTAVDQPDTTEPQGDFNSEFSRFLDTAVSSGQITQAKKALIQAVCTTPNASSLISLLQSGMATGGGSGGSATEEGVHQGRVPAHIAGSQPGAHAVFGRQQQIASMGAVANALNLPPHVEGLMMTELYGIPEPAAGRVAASTAAAHAAEGAAAANPGAGDDLGGGAMLGLEGMDSMELKDMELRDLMLEDVFSTMDTDAIMQHNSKLLEPLPNIIDVDDRAMLLGLWPPGQQRGSNSSAAPVNTTEAATKPPAAARDNTELPASLNPVPASLPSHAATANSVPPSLSSHAATARASSESGAASVPPLRERRSSTSMLDGVQGYDLAMLAEQTMANMGRHRHCSSSKPDGSQAGGRPTAKPVGSSNWAGTGPQQGVQQCQGPASADAAPSPFGPTSQAPLQAMQASQVSLQAVQPACEQQQPNAPWPCGEPSRGLCVEQSRGIGGGCGQPPAALQLSRTVREPAAWQSEGGAPQQASGSRMTSSHSLSGRNSQPNIPLPELHHMPTRDSQQHSHPPVLIAPQAASRAKRPRLVSQFLPQGPFPGISASASEGGSGSSAGKQAPLPPLGFLGALPLMSQLLGGSQAGSNGGMSLGSLRLPLPQIPNINADEWRQLDVPLPAASGTPKQAGMLTSDLDGPSIQEMIDVLLPPITDASAATAPAAASSSVVAVPLPGARTLVLGAHPGPGSTTLNNLGTHQSWQTPVPDHNQVRLLGSQHEDSPRAQLLTRGSGSVTSGSYTANAGRPSAGLPGNMSGAAGLPILELASNNQDDGSGMRACTLLTHISGPLPTPFGAGMPPNAMGQQQHLVAIPQHVSVEHNRRPSAGAPALPNTGAAFNMPALAGHSGSTGSPALPVGSLRQSLLEGDADTPTSPCRGGVSMAHALFAPSRLGHAGTSQACASPCLPACTSLQAQPSVRQQGSAAMFVVPEPDLQPMDMSGPLPQVTTGMLDNTLSNLGLASAILARPLGTAMLNSLATFDSSIGIIGMAAGEEIGMGGDGQGEGGEEEEEHVEMALGERRITRDRLTEVFHMPINEAAEQLGIGVTVLKKFCRKFKIERWPYRKLKSMDKLIASVEAQLPHDPHGSGYVLAELQRFKQEVYANPEACFDERIKKLRQANFKMEYKARQAQSNQAKLQLTQSGGAGADTAVAALARDDILGGASSGYDSPVSPSAVNARARARAQRNKPQPQ